MTTDLKRLTESTIIAFQKGHLDTDEIERDMEDAARIGADTLREEIRAALVRADEALKEKIAATDRADGLVAQLFIARQEAASLGRIADAAKDRADGLDAALARIGDAHNAQLHRAMNAEDKMKDLERLQHEIIGAMTDAGEYLPEQNPTAPGVVAARIADLARKAKSGFTVSRFVQEQREFSLTTFGPGKRTAGIIAHIRKELAEIEADPSDVGEWIDVVILALDGAWRAGHAADVIDAALWAKLAKNKARTWPDWRTFGEGEAIEHDRSGEVVDASFPVDTFDTGTRYSGGEVPMVGDVAKHPYSGDEFTVTGIDDDGDPIDEGGVNWLASARTLVRRKAVGVMADVVPDTITVADAKRLMVDMAQTATDADFPHGRGDFENWADVALAKLDAATPLTSSRPTMPKVEDGVIVLPSGRAVAEADLAVDVVVEGMARADRESLALFMCDRWRTWATTGGV